MTFPAIRTAVFAGGLLAFALSFDEIIVTNFLLNSLPKFIFNSIKLPRNRPVVNVVALVVVLLMLIPVYFAQKLAGKIRPRNECAFGGCRALEVLAARWARLGPVRLLLAGVLCEQAATPDLLELLPRRHLLREHRGLDPVEQPSSQPTSCAWAAHLGLGGHAVERRDDPRAP